MCSPEYVYVRPQMWSVLTIPYPLSPIAFVP
jgi:hypothetical protein